MQIKHVETLISKEEFASSSDWRAIRQSALDAVGAADWPPGSCREVSEHQTASAVARVPLTTIVRSIRRMAIDNMPRKQHPRNGLVLGTIGFAGILFMIPASAALDLSAPASIILTGGFFAIVLCGFYRWRKRPSLRETLAWQRAELIDQDTAPIDMIDLTDRIVELCNQGVEAVDAFAIVRREFPVCTLAQFKSAAMFAEKRTLAQQADWDQNGRELAAEMFCEICKPAIDAGHTDTREPSPIWSPGATLGPRRSRRVSTAARK